jgi:multiple sugar transport system ATP-binding protein
MARVEIRALTKEFPGGTRALDHLDLSIADGELFALLGPSGCGKTTLLRTIAGLEVPTSGSVWIGERDVTRLQPGARDVAMVFQDYALYPHMTVTDNVAYPLRVRGVRKAERHKRAAEAGANLSLAELLDRRPGQLSGGQQQRVALARAIAGRPQVFLFDEPLSNLDARLRLEARTFLKRLVREIGVTTVYVTHDQSEALALADRMAVMEAGRIRQLGTPTEVFQRPANVFVAAFIGSTPMNLIPATVLAGRLQVGPVRVPAPEPAADGALDGQDVTLGARPEYVTVERAEVADGIPGTVAVIENLGASLLVSVECDGQTIQAVTPEGAAPAIGEQVWLRVDTRRALLYDPEDGELIGAEEAMETATPAERGSESTARVDNVIHRPT